MRKKRQPNQFGVLEPQPTPVVADESVKSPSEDQPVAPPVEEKAVPVDEPKPVVEEDSSPEEDDDEDVVVLSNLNKDANEDDFVA